MLTEAELTARVRAVVDPQVMAMGLQYDARASDILRRCLMREYEAGHWKMTEPGEPFYATAWFNLAKNMNEPDEFVTPDGLAMRIETFKHTMLPTEWDIDKRYTDNLKDRYAVAAYPNCSVFTLNGVEHVSHSYAMVYFCASNPPEDMDWQPEGKDFPLAQGREITINREASDAPNIPTSDGDILGASPSTADGKFVERLIAHCNTAKATQPLHNKAHHDRWTHVKGLIGVHDFEGAKAYARLWAAKNWQAWVDLEKLLDDIDG